MNRPLSNELTSELGKLTDQDRERVLSYARSLTAARMKGTKGSSLLKFAGAIPKSELDRMRLAIESGCEGIDQDGW